MSKCYVHYFIDFKKIIASDTITLVIFFIDFYAIQILYILRHVYVQFTFYFRFLKKVFYLYMQNILKARMITSIIAKLCYNNWSIPYTESD